MTYSCPVISKQTDENVARLNALVTFLSIVLLLIVPFQWISVFLVADFFFRIYKYGKLNPLTKLHQYLLQNFKVAPVKINAGPKRFAAKIGLVLSLLIVVFYSSGYTVPANILAIVLMAFSFLEATFGFCVACKIYPFIYLSKKR